MGSGTNENFVDDMAQAVVFALENTLPDYLYNVGTGEDLNLQTISLKPYKK
jgi:GDP-L-fucose synthase